MDIAAFRDSFPQFSAELVPDARVQFHLTVAGKLLPAKRWDDLLDQGLGLYVAHQLTLERGPVHLARAAPWSMPGSTTTQSTASSSGSSCRL